MGVIPTMLDTKAIEARLAAGHRSATDAYDLLAENARLRGRLQSIADLAADTSPAVIAEMAREALG